MKKSTEAEELPIFFDAKELGRAMHEVGIDVIQSDSKNVVSRWFRSNRQTDLYVWEDEQNNVIKQQLVMCGQVIEWNIIQGVRTGITLEDESQPASLDGGHHEEAIQSPAHIQYDRSPMDDSITQASSLLAHMEVLAEELKRDLIENFIHSPTADAMEPEEFLRRYGQGIEAEDEYSKSPSAFHRILMKIARLFISE